MTSSISVQLQLSQVNFNVYLLVLVVLILGLILLYVVLWLTLPIVVNHSFSLLIETKTFLFVGVVSEMSIVVIRYGMFSIYRNPVSVLPVTHRSDQNTLVYCVGERV